MTSNFYVEPFGHGFLISDEIGRFRGAEEGWHYQPIVAGRAPFRTREAAEDAVEIEKARLNK